MEDSIDEEKDAFSKTKAVLIAHDITKRAYTRNASDTESTESTDDDENVEHIKAKVQDHPSQAERTFLVKNPNSEKGK